MSLVDGTAGSVGRVSVFLNYLSGIIPLSAVFPAIWWSIGESWVDACPPVTDILRLWAVTCFFFFFFPVNFKILRHLFFLFQGVIFPLTQQYLQQLQQSPSPTQCIFFYCSHLHSVFQTIFFDVSASAESTSISVGEIPLLHPLLHDVIEVKENIHPFSMELLLKYMVIWRRLLMQMITMQHQGA